MGLFGDILNVVEAPLAYLYKDKGGNPFERQVNDNYNNRRGTSGKPATALALGSEPVSGNELLDLLATQAMPSLIEQAKQGALDPTTLTTYANILTGRASEPEKLNFQIGALTSDLLGRLANGDLDDPEEAALALADWGKQTTTLQSQLGRFTGTTGQGELTPEDQLLADYQAYQRQQIVMDQVAFKRDGIMSLLSTIPISERFPALVSFMEADPSISELFFGDMTGSGGGGLGGLTGGGPAPTYQKFDVLGELQNIGVK